MDSTYLKNLNLLKENSEEIAFENSKNCQFIDDKLKIYRENKYWELESSKGGDLPVRMWCDGFKNVRKDTIFVMFGLGKLCYILQMVKQYPNSYIIVYEPEESVIDVQLNLAEMTELLENKKIRWICGKNRKKLLCQLIDTQLDYKNGFDIQYAAIPNYKKIFEEEWLFFEEHIKLANMYWEISKNTKVYGEKVRGKCYLNNIFDMVNEASVNDLVETFQKLDLQGVPAVLVSAGPSLDKNIKTLSANQNKAFIICVDSAIKTVKKYGITPDLLICADPIKNPELFENELGRQLPMITHMYCNYLITRNREGRKFYCSDGEAFEVNLLKKYNKKIGVLSTGGSVANIAFSFLQAAGFKTIILVGQDLAYPDKRMHTKEADDEVDFNMQKNRFFYVKDIYGNPVLSEYNMCMYRKWFEEQAIKFPEITIVDATEGGALIEGTKIMTLSKAFEKYGTKTKMNFSNVIQKVPYLFTKTKQKIVRDEMQTTVQNVQKIIEKLRGQSRIYDELDELNRGGKQGSKRFKRCLKEISEFNNDMDSQEEILLMQLYANEGDYEVGDQLQEESHSQYEEINLMVDVGRKLIATYICAGEKLLKVWGEISDSTEMSEGWDVDEE